MRGNADTILEMMSNLRVAMMHHAEITTMLDDLTHVALSLAMNLARTLCTGDMDVRNSVSS